MQRIPEVRAAFMAAMSTVDRHMLVFVDEMGTDERDYHRRRGWAPRGQRAVEETLQAPNHRARWNSCAALTLRDGIETLLVLPRGRRRRQHDQL